MTDVSAPEAGPATVAVTAPSIAIEHVAKAFGARHERVAALDDVSLEIGAGELVCIVGPSGCGKSTLLYMVGGFVEPSAGTICCDGVPVRGPGRDRGVVFQEFALFPWRTALGNVTYGMDRRLGAAERAERGRALLRLVGLEAAERRYPKELSGGMKQRVALARALATEPSTLLMDEPFGALDAMTRSNLQGELLAVWERLRPTVLFVTHSVDEAIFLADRIVVMTATPGQVRAVIDVPIPRPRDREAVIAHPDYARLHRHVWHLLTEPQ